MGAWSTGYFENDTALDLIISLETLDLSERRDFILGVAGAYKAFDEKRRKKLNVVIRTAEMAEILITAFSPPLSGEMAEMVRNGIGKPDEDPGDDEAHQLIGCAALLFAARSGNYAGLPQDARELPFRDIARDDQLVREVVNSLSLVPKNSSLSRDYGPRWKRGVLKLVKELADSIQPGV